MIFKLQLREVKYNESMTPKQWFQEQACMVLVVYKGNHVSEQYQMACMINALTLQQHFMFRPESDTTLEGFKTAFSEIFSQPMPCIKIGDDKLAL